MKLHTLIKTLEHGLDQTADMILSQEIEGIDRHVYEYNDWYIMTTLGSHISISIYDEQTYKRISNSRFPK